MKRNRRLIFLKLIILCWLIMIIWSTFCFEQSSQLIDQKQNIGTSYYFMSHKKSDSYSTSVELFIPQVQHFLSYKYSGAYPTSATALLIQRAQCFLLHEYSTYNTSTVFLIPQIQQCFLFHKYNSASHPTSTVLFYYTSTALILQVQRFLLHE